MRNKASGISCDGSRETDIDLFLDEYNQDFLCEMWEFYQNATRPEEKKEISNNITGSLSWAGLESGAGIYFSPNPIVSGDYGRILLVVQILPLLKISTYLGAEGYLTAQNILNPSQTIVYHWPDKNSRALVLRGENDLIKFQNGSIHVIAYDFRFSGVIVEFYRHEIMNSSKNKNPDMISFLDVYRDWSSQSFELLKNFGQRF